MGGADQVINILNQEFQRIKIKNPSYSLRSLARKLKVSPASLSGILTGKLNVTRRMGVKILTGIQADPSKVEKLLSQLSNLNSQHENAQVAINMDYYHLIADWFYFATLVLADIKGFQSNEKWIAKRLNIQVRQAKSALLNLERLGLLKKDLKNNLVSTGKQFKTSSGIPNIYLRYSHFQNLELAKKSLEKDGVEDCDFSAMTMAINPKDMPQAKEMLCEFRRAFCKRFEVEDKSEVFKLCLQFFPLTQFKKINFTKKGK